MNSYRKKLADEFAAKREERKIEKLIMTSQEKQAAIFSVMELRDQKMSDLKVAVIESLAGIEKNPNYPKLLINLIVQGLLRIQEEKVTIRCRKIDEPIVSKVLEQAATLFKKTVKDSTGYTPKLDALKIDAKYLPEPYTPGAADFSLGGVVLVARNGRILCKNSLEDRLETAFYQLKPQIRGMLFGVRSAKGSGKMV